MTAVGQKASKAEIVCDGQVGQKTTEIQDKGSKKKQLQSPRLSLACKRFFRQKVCILWSVGRNPGLHHGPATLQKEVLWVIRAIRELTQSDFSYSKEKLQSL